jgi:hypothetical protein
MNAPPRTSCGKLATRTLRREKEGVSDAFGAALWFAHEAVNATATRAHQALDASRVVDSALVAVCAWLSQHGERFEPDVVARPAEVSVPAGRLSLRPCVPADLHSPERCVRVCVNVWIDERFVRTVAVDFALRTQSQFEGRPAPAQRQQAGALRFFDMVD